MTCIIGLIKGDKVYLGGDSYSSDGWQKHAIMSPKVFRLGELLMGYTTSFRMGQLLQYHLNLPVQTQTMDDMSYLVTVVAAQARTLFKEQGYSKIDNNQEEGGEFLVGYRGHLYRIQQDFAVLQFHDAFDAIGAGAVFAVSVLAALETLPPKKRIKRAFKIAAHFTTVCAPDHILESEA